MLILLIILLLFLIASMLMLIKMKKKIWQKLDVIYNQIYIKLIQEYYKSWYGKSLLKNELQDYLEKVIINPSLKEKINYIEGINKFLEEFLWKDVEKILNQTEIYKKTLQSIDKLILLLTLSITLLFVMFITLLYL